MLYIFNQDDKYQNTITEETGLIDRWFKDYQNHLIDEPFKFTVDSASELLPLIVEENQVAFYDRDNRLRLMRIKEIYESSTNDGYILIVKCEPSFLELYDHFIEDRRFSNKTAQDALDGALQGSRYIGDVTVDLGNASDNFYWINAVDALFKIISTWGGALVDTIELDDDNEIVNRKIIIQQRLGSDSGLIVEPDYNAESIERKTLSYPVTAMWGQGASLETDGGGYTRYITFEDVVWSKANGDPVDKPKGQKWVGDPEALQKYGYLHNGVRQNRFGHFSNQEYETPQDLLWATWQALQEAKHPEINHEATITVDRPVSLGDTATIIDRNYNKPIELQSQITGLEYDPFYPDDDVKIVVGKYTDMTVNPLEKEVEDLKEEVAKPRPQKPIDNNSYPDVKPGIPVNVNAVGMFRAIMLDWDYDNAVYVSHYEVYGSQIKDFVPDTQHLLYRGRVSAFGHDVGSNETWYYRISAVNTRGTASDYSVQVSGTSTRIDFIDMADEIQKEIDDARDRANDAYTNANNATQNALDAIAQSQVGFNLAQDALEQSTNADSKANQALDKAQDGFNKAQDAIVKSDLAFNQSLESFNQSVEAFDKAQDSFDKAQANATDISGLALRMTNAEGDYASISGIVGGLQTQVGNIQGDVTEVTQLATGLQTRVNNAEGDITSLTQTATGLQTQVNDNKGNITSVTQLAQGLQTRVGDAEGNISTLKQTATQLNSTISDIERDLNAVGRWEKEYVVNTANSLPLLDSDGSQLSPDYTYEVTARIKLTSTNTTAIAIFEPTNSGWKLIKMKEFGTTSNHPEFFLEDGIPSIRLYNHSSLYSVAVTHEKNHGRENASSVINQTIDSISTRVQTNADNYSAMTQLVNGIQSEVNKKVDAITYSSKMTQLDNLIDSKVSTTTADGKYATKTQLTQTSDSITAQVNKKVDTATYNSYVQQTAQSLASKISETDANGKFATKSSLTQTAQGLQTQVNDKASQSTVTQLAGVIDSKISSIDANNKFATQSQLTQTSNSLTSRISDLPIWKHQLPRASQDNPIELTYPDGRSLRNNVAYEIYLSAYSGTSSDNFSIYTYEGGVLALKERSGTNVDARLFLNNGKVMVETHYNNATQSYPYTATVTEYEGVGARSVFSQLSDAINLRVQKNDVIHQINIDTSGVLIQGKQLMLDGDVTVTGGFRVNNANIASVDAAKMTTGTLDAAKVNIINLNANNIETGTLQGIVITGNTINGGTITGTRIVGGSFFNEGADGDVRIGNGRISATNFWAHVNGVYASETGFTVLRSYDDWIYLQTPDEVRVTKPRTYDQYSNLRAKDILTEGRFYSKGNYIGQNNTVFGSDNGMVMLRTTSWNDPVYLQGDRVIATKPGEPTAYVRITGNTLKSMNGHFEGTGDTSFTTSSGYVVLRASSNSQPVYLQGTEIRATLTTNAGSYVPVRASSFPTGTSLRENKTDIEPFNESVLDTLKNVTPYLYRIKGDEGNPYKQLGLMVDETPRYLHGEAGDSMEMYALGTFAIKGLKELDTKVINIESRMDEKDLQIQFLQQKIKQLEEKIAS